jgi:Uma2 family endonuclease
MREYVENACRLRWLVIAKTQQVEVYRINGSIEGLQSPITLSGETVLPGFVLNLATIFKTRQFKNEVQHPDQDCLSAM